jgi:cell division protease FtsH
MSVSAEPSRRLADAAHARARRLSDRDRHIGRTVAALLDESLQGSVAEPTAWFAQRLGVVEADCVQHVDRLGGFALTDVAVGLSRLLDRHPPAELAAAKPNTELRWVTIEGSHASIPLGWRAVWEPLPGTELTVGIRFEYLDGNQAMLTVYAHGGVLVRARHHLKVLLEQLAGEGTLPFQGCTVTVHATREGLHLRPLDLVPPDRDQLVLPDEVWQAVDRDIHGVLAKAPLLERAGLGLDRGVLFHGAPGTGKTDLVRIIAGEVTPKATVLLPDPYVALSHLTDTYQLAQRLRPAVVVLEDLDLLIGGRSRGSNLVDFLDAVDGARTEHLGVITIATSNYPGQLDEAVLRSSRLDRHVQVPLPTAAARRAILTRLLAPLGLEFTLEPIVEATDGSSGADLRNLVRTALLATDDLPNEANLLAALDIRTPRIPEGQYL